MIMHTYSSEEKEKKLKRENLETCLNCKRFLDCDDLGRFVECENFDEARDAVWVIKKT